MQRRQKAIGGVSEDKIFSIGWGCDWWMKAPRNQLQSRPLSLGGRRVAIVPDHDTFIPSYAATPPRPWPCGLKDS